MTLTMRCFRQRVATDGNGFRLFSPVSGRADLRLIAIGCNHGALSEEGPFVKSSAG